MGSQVPASGGITITGIPQVAGYTTNIYTTEPDGTQFYYLASTKDVAYSATSLAMGPELTTQFLDEPPEDATYTAFFSGNSYLAEYVQELDQSVVWFSEDMGYHQFNLNSNYFVVPGEVTQMYGSSQGLLVATRNRTFWYADKLEQLAEYGSVPGQHADLGPDGKVYFWSKQGLCRAAPFENMTEKNISVAPGLWAGGAIVEAGGYRRFIALLHVGGSPFNQR